MLRLPGEPNWPACQLFTESMSAIMVQMHVLTRIVRPGGWLLMMPKLSDGGNAAASVCRLIRG